MTNPDRPSFPPSIRDSLDNRGDLTWQQIDDIENGRLTLDEVLFGFTAIKETDITPFEIFPDQAEGIEEPLVPIVYGPPTDDERKEKLLHDYGIRAPKK